MARVAPTATVSPVSSPVPGVVRASTRDFVADYIRERIFEGDYPPYSRIPQDDVAAAVGMSRIPVREALVQLEAEGYVSMPTNRGAFVVPYSAYDLLCAFELRGFVTGMAARRAASKANAELVTTLEDVHRQMRRVTSPEEFRPLTFDFTKAILDAGGSPRLDAAFWRMRNIVPGNFYAVVPGAMEAARTGYRDEVKAQRDRDPERALTAAVQASLAQGECLVRLLRERGQLVGDDVGGDIGGGGPEGRPQA
jgi:DNA-binding GntR family transcriptional regulator